MGRKARQSIDGYRRGESQEKRKTRQAETRMPFEYESVAATVRRRTPGCRLGPYLTGAVIPFWDFGASCRVCERTSRIQSLVGLK